MKFGDSVLYIENGQEYNATVVGSRILDNHLGSDDEPLIDLAFFKEVLAPGADGKPAPKKVIGTSAQYDLVQFRLDVAHSSHEYDEEAQKKHGPSYPGGRWEEVRTSYFTGHQSADDDDKG